MKIVDINYNWTIFVTTFILTGLEVNLKTIGAAQFKEQCLSLLETVDKEGLIITKHGRPVAKLIPVSAQSSSLIGSLKGKIQFKGDVLSTGVKWDAES